MEFTDAVNGQETGIIIGRVVTKDDRPVADAAVMITGKSPAHNDIAILTDSDGEFRFDGLPTGDYTVLVNAEGFPQQTGQVRVQAAHKSRLDITLRG